MVVASASSALSANELSARNRKLRCVASILLTASALRPGPNTTELSCQWKRSAEVSSRKPLKRTGLERRTRLVAELGAIEREIGSQVFSADNSCPDAPKRKTPNRTQPRVAMSGRTG